MVDFGPRSERTEDDDDLGVFVDRLAAAGSDRATGLAKAQIRRGIAAGVSPPGLRRLAEALAATVAEPPPPRRPTEDVATVASAVGDHTLVVLDGFDTAAVAAAVASMVDDGRRVVVTAATPDELAAVRDALPGDAAARALDRLPPLSPPELRELRKLLATSSPDRRARAGQRLPEDGDLPAVAEVARLCAMASRPTGEGSGVRLVPGLLADLDEARRDAVASVARCVRRSLGELHPRADRQWAWALLDELIYGRQRAAFDGLLEGTAQAAAALQRSRRSETVSFLGAPPTEALDLLRRYRDFLQAGGRTRSYFRSGPRREVYPVLQQSRVGSRVPETAADISRIIEHLELAERLRRIDAGCVGIGAPVPRDEQDLTELSDLLVKVAAAARSVGALRHDVLFLGANSPLAVPDVESAEQIADAIGDYTDHGSAADGGQRLDALADELAGRATVAATAPEHELAVAALRTHDVDAYASALESLGAARREARDEARRSALLARLRDAAPRLAESWTGSEPVALGVATFLLTDALLSAVPPPDSADVVLVLGAARLGVERLLLTAVAPRMVAVVGPGERPDRAPTLLSVLQRATALVIRSRPTGGRSGRVGAGIRPVRAPVGQAGA